MPTSDIAILADVHPLATTNALLNAAASVLLIVGFVLIKAGRVRAHRHAMLAAFATSVLFLICYLAYHVWPVGAAATKFPGPDSVRVVYYVILASHIVLAMAVPVLTVATIYFGLSDQRPRHRRWARWTFPIWLYVSVTGVVIYVFLYHLYPPPAG